jgi:hypothetical protein
MYALCHVSRRYIAVCNSANFKTLDISRDICTLLLHSDNIIILYYIIHVLYRLNIRMMNDCYNINNEIMIDRMQLSWKNKMSHSSETVMLNQALAAFCRYI